MVESFKYFLNEFKIHELGQTVIVIRGSGQIVAPTYCIYRREDNRDLLPIRYIKHLDIKE